MSFFQIFTRIQFDSDSYFSRWVEQNQLQGAQNK